MAMGMVMAEPRPWMNLNERSELKSHAKMYRRETTA